MKKTTLKLMLTLTCVAALTAFALAAMPVTLLTANIPFDFQVNNRTYPAGTYTVSRASSPNAVVLRNEQQPNHNVVTLTHANNSRTENGKASLEFRRYGDQYFLSRVMPRGTATNLELQKSRNEREAADNTKNLAGHTIQPEIISIAGQ